MRTAENDEPAETAELARPALRIHGTIARDLGIQIVSGALSPGQLLDTEIMSSERLSVSRTVYREAVRTLAAKGLVDAKPKVGTRVNDPAKWNLFDPDVLSWIFEQTPPPSLVAALFEMRSIFEPRIAALAASRRTVEQLTRMRTAISDMQRFTLSTAEGREADQRFHATLIEASDNPFLGSLSSGIGAAVAWTTSYKARAGWLRRDAIPDHVEVLDAISASDPFRAHAAMLKLVDLAYTETINASAGT